MAGRSRGYSSPEPSGACQSLLLQLKKGQDVLKRSIENIKPPVAVSAASQQLLSKRKLESRCRDSLTINLNRVDKLPTKRARLQQLTPDYEFSSSDLFPPTKTSPINKRPRRLSSTPVKTTPNQCPVVEPQLDSPPPPSLPPADGAQHDIDFSLEEALFDKENNYCGGSYALPSPKLSKIEVDTSRSINGVKPPFSALRKSGQDKKRRGLTVSFVQHDTGKSSEKSSCAKFTRHATQRKIMDGGLIDSLNSLRHGALEQRHSGGHQSEGGSPLAKRHSQGREGRRGGDPRLGYDWIAGLLETSESYLDEKDDDFFRDINEFRRVNFEECHKPKEVLLPISADEQLKEESSEDETLDRDTKTTCVRSYMLNDRLFPIHTSSLEHAPGEFCPACEDKPTKASNPPARYVRVSVPHSVLQAPTKFRAHRRRSFDPTDSMGLSKVYLCLEVNSSCLVVCKYVALPGRLGNGQAIHGPSTAHHRPEIIPLEREA